MAGEYYDHTTYPSQGAAGSSSAARAEFELIEAGFNKLPVLAGNGSKLAAINAGGTAMEAITAAQALAAIGAQATSAKDVSGGYAGLTLFKLNLRNAANTITSWFTTAATIARTWTMPDKDGTVAMTSDITGGTSAGSFTTLTASGATTLPAGVQVTGAALLGYGTGAGGTVTQATSKTTAVTLNKPSGVITMAPDSLSAGASLNFSVNNTVAVDGCVGVVNITGVGQLMSYSVRCRVSSGLLVVAVKNETAGALAEAVVITFELLRAASS